MKPIPERKREAAQALTAAVEEALGVQGPTQLGRRTGRSQSWWTKLGQGQGHFPLWSELEALLPTDVSEASSRCCGSVI